MSTQQGKMVRIDPLLHYRLKILSAELGVSLSTLVERACRVELDKFAVLVGSKASDATLPEAE
jgi:predicted HicB family RNase H-like nuclease